MTSLSDLKAAAGSDGDVAPFNFKRIGDAVKGVIQSSKFVEVSNDDGSKRTKLLVTLLVEAAKGGVVVKDEDGMITGTSDFPADTECNVWLTPNGIAAVTKAVEASGNTVLANGGTLVVTRTERKDTGKAQKLTVFSASDVPPAAGTSQGDEDPFA